MFKKLAVLSFSPILFASSISAQTVDLELLLGVDVSGSVDNTEFSLQRQGYIDALNDTDIVNAIVNSPNGVAVALTYWASTDNFLEIPWTLLQNTNDISNFANTIANSSRPNNEGSGTSVFAPINSSINGFSGDGGASFLTNTFNSNRLVLDISGDGGSNSLLTQDARDQAVAQNIIINGLAIENFSNNTIITDFYNNNVIGGDGAFVETANGFEDFSNAIIRKLEAEIPDPDPDPETTHEPLSLLALLGIGILFSINEMKRKLVSTKS